MRISMFNCVFLLSLKVYCALFSAIIVGQQGCLLQFKDTKLHMLRQGEDATIHSFISAFVIFVMHVL